MSGIILDHTGNTLPVPQWNSVVIPMYYWSTEGRDVFEGKKGGGKREKVCGCRCMCVCGGEGGGGGGKDRTQCEASIYRSIPQICPPPPSPSRISPSAFLVQSLANVQ